MKVRSIDSASLLIAGVAAATGVGAGIVVQADGWVVVGICVVTFLLTGLAARAVIKKFVIYKIKPIYQIVLSRNIKTSELDVVGHAAFGCREVMTLPWDKVSFQCL